MSRLLQDQGAVGALPRGPHGLSRETVLASQRGRMLAAMADVVAVDGYSQTTVAAVIARAGVSRKTFYEHFTDKAACFLEAYDTAARLLMDQMRAVSIDDMSLRDAIATRTRAYLDMLATEPGVAHTFLIEIAAAGPEALARRDAVLDAFVALVGELAPDASAERLLAVVGATDALVTRWVREGRARDLGGLVDEVVTIHLALLAPPAR